jgi:Arc/MetJ-type ribon-helix-helix transcriptional regulator
MLRRRSQAVTRYGRFGRRSSVGRRSVRSWLIRAETKAGERLACADGITTQCLDPAPEPAREEAEHTKAGDTEPDEHQRPAEQTHGDMKSRRTRRGWRAA